MPDTNVNEDYDYEYTDSFHDRESHPKSTSRGCFRSGAHFIGKQVTGRSTYNVEVTFHYVDVSQSFACGYLQISNLVQDHPNLTTFFEAEIIGKDHSFFTEKWGTTDLIDKQHWLKFDQFDSEKFLHSKETYDFEGKDFIYMRWKEIFLVPDHTVDRINGASYDGFYYICLQLSTDSILGYYYHPNSEWYQQLCLDLVKSRSFPSFEFR